jgi:phenylacetate-CoA ligase
MPDADSRLMAFGCMPRILMLLNLLAEARRSPAAIRRIQERKLRAMVAHAYRRVPFYRQLYLAAGFDPFSIKNLEDLARLPMVSKEDFLGRPLSEVLAAGVSPEKCESASSSGSSGRPLTAYWHPRDRAMMNMGWKRAQLLSGMGWRDRLADFSGSRPMERPAHWPERFGFFPRRAISSRLEPPQWIEILRDWRPAVISGSIMTLRLLAEYVRDRRITDVRPRLIFNFSEFMGDASRRLLSEVFGCSVIDLYGSEEAGCIAWECPACSGYHIASDMNVVEVLRDGKPALPGESGEVVITNLHSRAMPFIRYRQGDVVTLARRDPGCGIPFPLISGIEGRDEDFLILGDGRRLPPPPVYHCLDPVPGIVRWRIVQEMAGSMRLELMVGDGFSTERLARIKDDLSSLTKGRMAVEVVLVDMIPVDAGVKFKAIRSRAGNWSR